MCYPFLFIPIFLCIASHNDVHIGYSCHAGPATGAPINPLHLPWSVYVYGPDVFTREHLVGRNINVMGYHFPEGTRAMSSSSFLSHFLSYSCIRTLVLTLFLQNSAHCSGARGASLACGEPQAGDEGVFLEDLWS